MTDHRQLLATFLHTDLLRLEGALARGAWGPAAAERIADHLRFARLLQGSYMAGQRPPPTAPPVPLPRDGLEAAALLRHQVEGLIAALQRMDDATLHAPLLDPHERGLTLLGHLYDFCRASAMLVEWARQLPEEAAAPLHDWFDDL